LFIFPLPGCDFTGSLNVWNKDMNLYHVSLKDKFNDSNGVSVDRFLQHANEVLHANLTGDSTLMDVMRMALKSGDMIAYTTKNNHSMSLQMWNRVGLKDYVPPEKNVIPPSPEKQKIKTENNNIKFY
jgi:hypothetical protein